jgi:hypothetical protein
MARRSLLPGGAILAATQFFRGGIVAMEWVGANKDFLSLLIAFMATLVSLATVLFGRRNSQVQSFISMQALMLNSELQRGRLLVYRSIETGELPPRDSDEEYLMARSLAVFDMLGMFVRLRILPLRWVLWFWHPRLQLLRHSFGLDADPDRPYILTERPDLEYLVAEAVRYVCNRKCCAGGLRERRLKPPEKRTPKRRTERPRVVLTERLGNHSLRARARVKAGSSRGKSIGRGRW